jgi:AraC-like DNA-binding protein
MKLYSPRFLSIGHLLPWAGWKMDAHFHPFHHELIVVIAGRLGVEINGQTIEAGPGEVLWYPQNVSHREWTERKTPVESFFIGFEYPGLPLPTVLHESDNQGRIQALARWLYAERETRAASAPSSVENAFLQAILAEYHRLTLRQENSLVARVRAYMRQRLASPISLDDLANHAGMSKFHFIRQYKELTGRTPMRDLQHLRIQVARDLLLTTNLPLKEISPRSGLGDEYHLSRLFRSHFNTPPGTLRRRNATR